MDRPLGYQDGYVVNRNMPYEMVELLPCGECLSGGVLGKGQRVWMQHDPQDPAICHAVSVYAENLGIIKLDLHCISRLS